MSRTNAIFAHWQVIDRDPERVLRDLRQYSEINTLLVSLSATRSWADTPTESALALPSGEPFGDLPVPVSAEEYDRTRRFIDLAKSEGFTIVCHTCPTMLFSNKLSDLCCYTVYDQNLDAKSTDLKLWACPNNPDTIKYATTLAAEAVRSWQGADMLELNHVEYSIFPRDDMSNLFICFCDHCRDKALSQKLDFDRIKAAARSLHERLLSRRASGPHVAQDFNSNGLLNFLIEEPAIAQWLNFRMNSMSDLIRATTAAARESAASHNPDLKIGLDVFLPSMAALAGTDAVGLFRLFDWVSPKFPDYLTGSIVPRLADRLASAAGPDKADSLREALRQLFDVGSGPESYEPIDPPDEDLLFSNTFDVSVIERQMNHLKPLIGNVPMYPWIWMYHRNLGSLRQKLETTERVGFDGFFLWCWERDLSTEGLRESQGVF